MRILSIYIALSILVLTSCNEPLKPTERDIENMPGSIVGNWVIEKQVYGWYNPDSSLAEVLFPIDDPAGVKIMQILTDSIKVAMNIASGSHFRTSTLGPYEIINDSLLLHDGDTTLYMFNGRNLSILAIRYNSLYGDIYAQGWEVSRYIKQFPPKEWTNAIEIPELYGYWQMYRLVMEINFGFLGVEALLDTTLNTNDMTIAMFIKIEPDSMHSYVNEPAVSSYMHESMPVSITATTISPLDGAILTSDDQYTLNSDSLVIWNEVSGNGISHRYEMYLKRFNGPFPPNEWQTPSTIKPDQYEPDDNLQQATNIEVGTIEQQHTLTIAEFDAVTVSGDKHFTITGGEFDWYRFDAKPFIPYTIETKGSVNHEITLFVSMGDMSYSSDRHSDFGKYGRVTWVDSTANTRYIMIHCYTDPPSVGSYSISVRKAPIATRRRRRPSPTDSVINPWWFPAIFPQR